MKTGDLMIRCLAVREGKQWVGICLPFDLAAQADTLPEMKAKMDEQIRHYLQDALAGQDRAHAGYLITRRAPLKYWLIYAFATVLDHGRKAANFRHFRTPVPLAPAYC